MTEQEPTAHRSGAAPDDKPNGQRDLWPAVRNGLFCRCPRCGRSDLFQGFLQQVSACPNCGERLGNINVGLLLPFVVIMIVAHVIIFVMLDMELNERDSPLVYLAVLVRSRC